MNAFCSGEVIVVRYCSTLLKGKVYADCVFEVMCFSSATLYAGIVLPFKQWQHELHELNNSLVI